VGVCEPDTLASDAVDVWSLYFALRIVGRYVAVAQVIAKNQHNIRAFDGKGVGCQIKKSSETGCQEIEGILHGSFFAFRRPLVKRFSPPVRIYRKEIIGAQ
jgi:hypothetical protein